MIEKIKNCFYCGKEMESITAKKRFCSDVHRVYYNREKNKNNTFKLSEKNEKQTIFDIKVSNLIEKNINNQYNKPPKSKGESSLDYQIRLKELGF